MPILDHETHSAHPWEVFLQALILPLSPMSPSTISSKSDCKSRASWLVPKFGHFHGDLVTKKISSYLVLPPIKEGHLSVNGHFVQRICSLG